MEQPIKRQPGAPQGERWPGVDKRTQSVLNRLQAQGKDALVVSHGYFIRSILAHAVLGLSSSSIRRFSLDNAAFVVLSGSPFNWTVVGHNVGVVA